MTAIPRTLAELRAAQTRTPLMIPYCDQLPDSDWKAELRLNRDLEAAIQTKLTIPSNCRLYTVDGGKSWRFQGGGGEVVWFEEPTQTDIDKASRLLIDPARNATGGPYFAERG